MIRRHFLAGLVGIKALCAAAALAVGAGQAQAATVDRVTITLTGKYNCFYHYCDDLDPAPSFDRFYGLPVDQAITGWLFIGDPNQFRERVISFTVDDLVYPFYGGFIDYFSDGFYQATSFGSQFNLAWNGIVGYIFYMDDASPWSSEVHGTISLAPVPLPATAALLPLGVGALAMLRRRRRLA